MAQLKPTVVPIAAERVAVNVAVSCPRSLRETETSLTERAGSGSSSVIVPSPEPSPIVAFEGLDRVMPKFSLPSARRSPFTVMPIVAVVAPAAIVRLPLAAT